MPKISFSLNIQTDELAKYYKGQAQSIFVRASNGQTLQFPASLVLPFVSHSGVSGEFSLSFDGKGKAIELTKI